MAVSTKSKAGTTCGDGPLEPTATLTSSRAARGTSSQTISTGRSSAASRSWFVQSLALREAHDYAGFVHALAEFAALAAAEGFPACALRLGGATAALTQKTGILVQHSERGRHSRWLATPRQALPEHVAAAVWAEGREMRLDQAIAHALAPCELVAAAASTATEPRPAQPSGQLTAREREVAALVALGNSNPQIGQALVIT